MPSMVLEAADLVHFSSWKYWKSGQHRLMQGCPSIAYIWITKKLSTAFPMRDFYGKCKPTASMERLAIGSGSS